jgi:hypothetical protein
MEQFENRKEGREEDERDRKTKRQRQEVKRPL